MKFFTEHTQQQGVTYFEHCLFALGIAWRLMNSVLAFVLHAVFPFIGIERRYDLEETMDFLDERNRWIEHAGRVKLSVSSPMFELTEYNKGSG